MCLCLILKGIMKEYTIFASYSRPSHHIILYSWTTMCSYLLAMQVPING